MKITCSRYDELKAKRAQYLRDVEKYNKASDEAMRKRRAAKDDALAPVKNALVAGLSKFNLLAFDLRVDEGWSGIEARVTCNERDLFNPKNALAWSYTAQIDEETGEVTRETSSWSGLKATNEEQLDSLKQTYEALIYLNSIDWKTLLNIQLPNYEDYTKGIIRPNEEVTQRELDEALLESLIGQNKAIAIHNPNSERSRWDPDYYFAKILKDSGSQYTVELVGAGRSRSINEQAQQNAIDAFRGGSTWSRRIRKDNIKLYNPQTIIEF